MKITFFLFNKNIIVISTFTLFYHNLFLLLLSCFLIKSSKGAWINWIQVVGVFWSPNQIRWLLDRECVTPVTPLISLQLTFDNQCAVNIHRIISFSHFYITIFVSLLFNILLLCCWCWLWWWWWWWVSCHWEFSPNKHSIVKQLNFACFDIWHCLAFV